MRFAIILGFFMALAGAASAQGMRRAVPPADCLSLYAPGPDPYLVDWRQMVEVEHCDRMKRLQRLTSLSTLQNSVEFYDASVAADRLPPEVNVRIPLLRVVFPDRVFFDTDSADMRPEAWEIVRIVAASLRSEPPDVALFVVGHADERGANDYNYNLSIDRANALAEALVGSGVNVASVWRLGFGEDMPLVAGSNEYSWSRNRRIEFLFAARPEAIPAWIVDQQLDMTCQASTLAEAEACKARLEVKPVYTALEVLASPEDLDLASQGVTVNATSEKTVVNVQQQKRTLELRKPRKIQLYPVNRKVGEIEVEG